MGRLSKETTVAKTATKKAAKKTTSKKTSEASSKEDEHQKTTAESLPRRSLEQAVEVAKILWAVYATKAVSLQELATAMKMNRTHPNFKYLVRAAVAYGIVNAEGPTTSRTFSLAETGRKIVAENDPGEADEGKIKAALTPTVFSKFFTDYNGHAIPPTDEHFANVLENRFAVPRERTAEAIEIIKANGKYAGILEEQSEGKPPVVRLTGVPTAEEPLSAEPGIVPTQATSAASASGWDKTCFYITPIGDDGTEERRHANMMLKHVVRPVFEAAGFKVVRADEIAKTGIISQQVFEHLAKAKLCVADLSFHNPNAFYELGVRHAFLLPTIQLIHKSKKIPFDVSQGRTITIDTADNYMVADHLDSARKTLSEYLKNLLAGTAGADDNPVAIYLPGLKVTIPK
jgi:hypothetical protein